MKEKLVTEDLSKGLMQAAAVPHYENSILKGFKFLEIDKDSLYEQSGLKNGDIVTVVNGHQLDQVIGKEDLAVT